MSKTIKTVLRYYYCDTDSRWGRTPPDALEYMRVFKKNTEWGRVVSRGGNVYQKTKEWYTRISKMHRTVVELETDILFDNQWNTVCGMRLHDWSEAGYDNEHIHEGYYLDLTQEMYDIRLKTSKCAYCGAHYKSPIIDFCRKHDECQDFGFVSLTRYTANPKEVKNEIRKLRTTTKKQK